MTAKGLLKALKNVLVAPFRGGWLGFVWLMRLVLYAALAAALFAAVVMGHGLWHMSHPLDNPKFKGLTYWQLLEWEKMVTDQQATAWNQAHPNAKNPAGWQTCVEPEIGVYVFMAYPNAGRIRLPYLLKGPAEYFRSVDETWESWVWLSVGSPNLVKYCETAARHPVPTPEQLEQYKLEYQAWKAQQEAACQAGK